MRGRSLYVASCTGCHRLYLPGEFDPAAWRAVMPTMARKARLTAEDEDVVLGYVLAAREVVP